MLIWSGHISIVVDVWTAGNKQLGLGISCPTSTWWKVCYYGKLASLKYMYNPIIYTNKILAGILATLRFILDNYSILLKYAVYLKLLRKEEEESEDSLTS